jgi:glycosyltransferase involved in cell wall biosynthesis
MNLPSISIVIPTYNCERTIKACLDSIVRQDYPKDKIEVIIVDGGSKDKTLEIARKYGVDKNLRNSLLATNAENGTPLVSVNIPTYNSEKTLDECLRSIANQTYRNIEIIIVDSYSYDQTLEIAKNYGAKIYFADTLSEARKVGVENSLGKYVFFVDSDQVLTPDMIEKCVNKCEKEGYDAITLFERSMIKKGTFIERVIAYDKWLFHSQHDDHPIYGSAIPRFFRTEVLKRIKWPSSLGVQEHNLIYYEVIKMGAKSAFMDLYIYHREPYLLTQFVRKFYRYGFYYIPALHQNKRLVIAHSMPRRVYFSKKALKRPTLFVGILWLYLIKAMATFAGIIAYLLKKGKI